MNFNLNNIDNYWLSILNINSYYNNFIDIIFREDGMYEYLLSLLSKNY